MKKKKGDDEMNATTQPKQKTDRKSRVQDSYNKIKQKNGKALERLSKN
ncbi:hypothetical protein [Fictibacillus fluitans]|uniref:Uncharacterized protein n=1 Tax=Fictibacillus fluitans TaxID=3058422 RepID=A0ABT8HVW2_9BACL|nr:hypothetical protein [Fictibacillus sp. NE201]MDN4524402.1 hypothetical protein [Fictibacillus sp. NE201]